MRKPLSFACAIMALTLPVGATVTATILAGGETDLLVYSNAQGNKTTWTVPPSSDITARTMTIYILPAADRADVLELHLAWEMELSNAPVKLAYVDAISGNVLAAQ